MSGKHIVLYTSNPCAQCDKVRDMLDSWGVSYEEKTVTGNPDNLRTIQQEGIYGTPVTFVEGETVLGVQESRLKKKLTA
ncbi:glutaredoxin family protein [Salimicrobium sp. PL1-032A]|uniref:glutaredoxin family protein n=1 Tax=Salimicrobium sp. PL1-032A TaxID=3095364 RepID=UPI003261676F